MSEKKCFITLEPVIQRKTVCHSAQSHLFQAYLYGFEPIQVRAYSNSNHGEIIRDSNDYHLYIEIFLIPVISRFCNTIFFEDFADTNFVGNIRFQLIHLRQ